MPAPDLALYRIAGIPLITPGDDLARILSGCLQHMALALQPGDILAVAQKIVSKAEGRIVNLATVKPSDAAIELATETGKDPRVVELILNESRRIVRKSPGILITEHRLGHVMANAGIDRSNVAGDEDTVLLLPEDPDRSAQTLRQRLRELAGIAPGVIVTDSFGRPWRMGTTGVAIGCAGVAVLEDLRGHRDLFERELQVAETATADALAAAAGILMGEGADRCPAVLIRGLPPAATDQPASAVLRPPAEDLFR